ncbi:MAG: phage holin family protein [Dehalococcoidia bacterium]|nr:phage holin family protein [Dehalococcoidia bacterium]
MAEPERPFPRQERIRPESIGGAVSELLSDLEDLIHSEIRLARTGMIGDLQALGRDAAIIAIGGALAFLGFAFLLVALMFGLAALLPNWAAALIIGAVTLIIGGLLAWSGRRRLTSLNPAPERTIQTLREDAE